MRKKSLLNNISYPDSGGFELELQPGDGRIGIRYMDPDSDPAPVKIRYTKFSVCANDS